MIYHSKDTMIPFLNEEIMSEKISIIVPVYNAENTLERCINSLVNQTYTNLEIILVNDGSKDKSLSLCNEFSNKDERIKVINKSNGGVSSARNAGLDIATGKFVMFCDSDDMVNCDWCRIMMNEYEENSLLMCKFDEVSNEVIADCEVSIFSYDIHRYDREKFMLLRDIGVGLPTNKIYDNAIIQQNNIRFPIGINLGEDLIFVASYLCCINGNIKYIDCGLYYYTVQMSSSLSSSSPTYEQSASLYDLLCDVYYKMNICDSLSILERDKMIARDFEKMFIKIKNNKRMSFINRYKCIKQGMKSVTFKSVISNKKVKFSTNPIYEFSLATKNALLFLLI